MAVCLAGAVFAAGIASPAAQHASAAPAAPETEPPGSEQQFELVISPEAPVVTSATAEVTFSVLLRNSGQTTAPEGSVALAIGERLVGASALQPADPSVTEPSDAAAATPRTIIATVNVDAVAPGDAVATTVTVERADIDAFSPNGHGVYPIYGTYASSDSDLTAPLTAYTPIVWEGPEAAKSVQLGSIVPLTFPAEVQSMPSRAQLGDAVARFEALVDAAQSARSVLAIDPRLITAIRGYGTEAPRAATELLDRLEHTNIPSFLLQFGDADPAAQAALGFDALLQPAGFEFITRYGAWEQAPAASEAEPSEPADGELAGADTAGTGAGANGAGADTAGSDAGAGADNDADPEPAAPSDGADTELGVAPTDAELNDWPAGLAAAWPAPGQVSHRTLALLQGAGLDLTVLSSANVRLTGGPRATLAGGGALVTDSELDAAARLALGGETRAERDLGSAQAAARLALAAESGVKGLLVGLDRGGVAASELAAELLADFTAPRWVSPAPYTELAEGAAVLEPQTPDDTRLELLEAAVANEPNVREVRALLTHPEYMDSYQRMRLLTFFGTSHAAADSDFSATARQFAGRDAELRDGVRLVDTKRAQLVGGSTRIPIQLRNALPFEARVTLEVAPTSAALRLPERTFAGIELPEDSSERVLVPATSRVSSGESAILLSVSSTDGEFLASSGRLEVAISSAVETVAITILAAAAALLFGFGIWRSIRRRRSLSTKE